MHELQHLSYSYDDAGILLSAKDALELGGLPKDQQCFDYDWAQCLTQAWTPANGDCAATPSVAGLGGGAPTVSAVGMVGGGLAGKVVARSAMKGLDEMRPTYSRWGSPVDADGRVVERQITAAYEKRYKAVAFGASEATGTVVSGGISAAGNVLIGKE